MWKPQCRPRGQARPRRTVRRTGNRGRGVAASRLSSTESWVVVPWIRSGHRTGPSGLQYGSTLRREMEKRNLLAVAHGVHCNGTMRFFASMEPHKEDSSCTLVSSRGSKEEIWIGEGSCSCLLASKRS
ncbi:hypothetical protein C2845_PM16G04950 [Panicum miliaceum]|uniref:Uncharacterized protein n=1 Tax=Panicum miliaceum TaxID=4540 RepID=A0A3L6PSM0_PANMI|nr:hypothetical protein C2845_PM16G04950 [Panicum miliaceum]